MEDGVARLVQHSSNEAEEAVVGRRLGQCDCGLAMLDEDEGEADTAWSRSDAEALDVVGPRHGF
jgi:hypothetical protein